MENIMISNEKKLAAVIGVLPVMMDFMEDIRDQYPNVYDKRIKKSGNDFIEAVEKSINHLYKKMDHEYEKDVHEFYYELVNMGNHFRQWLESL
jgi:archaellum component FlaC